MKKELLTRGQEITIISIVVIVLYLIIGNFVSPFFVEKSINESIVVQQSIKTKDKEQFNYSIDTQQGNILHKGMFKANELVKFDEMNKSFGSVHRVIEHYVMKTRTVSYKCGKSTCTRVETYWVWEVKKRETLIGKKIEFEEREYNSDLFEFTNHVSIDAEQIVNGATGKYYKPQSSIRHSYSILEDRFSGTVFLSSKDGTVGPIKGNKIEVHNKDVDKYVEDAINKAESSKFWFWFWWVASPIIIAGIIFVKMNE